MDLATLDFDIETINRLCRVVRSAPPEKFRMEQFFTTTACGTSACIAGHGLMDDSMCGRIGIERECGRVPLDSHSGRQFVSRVFRSGAEQGRIPFNDFFGPRDVPARWYLFHENSWDRSSAVDDAPFDPTPAEKIALGYDYARGLAEREAALNRLAIVRACLVKWRAALAPTVAREIETRPPQLAVTL